MAQQSIIPLETLMTKQVRESLEQTMLRAAQEFKVAITSHNLIYVSRDDITAINAGIQGIEKLTPRDFQTGANLMFHYISLPSGARLRGSQQSLPQGYYLVRAFFDQSTGKSKAQLLDEAGKLVLEIPAEIEIHAPPSEVTPMRYVAAATGGIDTNLCVTLDIHVSVVNQDGTLSGALDAKVKYCIN